MKKIFKFYINANIHVAIAVMCLLQVVSVYLNIEVFYEALFLFLSTFVSYNFIRYRKWKDNELKSELLEWFENNYKVLIFLNLLALIGLLFYVFHFKVSTMLLIVPFAGVTLLYMVPVFKFIGLNTPLRSLPTIKIFSISFSWAGLVVFLPAAENEILFEPTTVYLFLMTFLFVITLTLPFDIRDVNFDNDKIKTFPQRFGVNLTKLIGVCCLFVMLIIELLTFQSNIVTVIISVLLILLILFSSISQSKYYASFWVEGIPIVWWALYLFIEN
jgi:hypothetical protein